MTHPPPAAPGLPAGTAASARSAGRGRRSGRQVTILSETAAKEAAARPAGRGAARISCVPGPTPGATARSHRAAAPEPSRAGPGRAGQSSVSGVPV